jgi:hypothetical protein
VHDGLAVKTEKNRNMTFHCGIAPDHAIPASALPALASLSGVAAIPPAAKRIVQADIVRGAYRGQTEIFD